MRQKINIAVLSVFVTVTMYAAEADNGYGTYKIPMPQKTYASSEKRTEACKALGDDYMVPNIEELFNMPDELRSAGERSLYASSTQNPQNSDEIYYYSFENRDVNIVSKKENLYLVCIKKAKTTPSKKLVWSKEERNRMDYKEAKAFCEAKGERLPSSKELFSLALEKLSDEKAFAAKYGQAYPKYHWSIDANEDFSNTAIVVGFMRASVASSAKDNKSFVRCVKDAK